MNSKLATVNTIIFHNTVPVLLPAGHRFEMGKSAWVKLALEAKYKTHPKILFKTSPFATDSELETTHSPEYIKKFLSGRLSPAEIRKVGFPWSPALVNRSLLSVGGTVAAMRYVCESPIANQFACHIGGGTHHAFYDRGEGFCVFSDIAVAVNLSLVEYPNVVKRILVVDLDVHQGWLFLYRYGLRVLTIYCRKWKRVAFEVAARGVHFFHALQAKPILCEAIIRFRSGS